MNDSFIIFSDTEIRGFFFAVKLILHSIRDVGSSEHSVASFIEKLADYLEHISHADEVSLMHYDEWKARCAFLSAQYEQALERIPKDVLRTTVRELLAPITPKIRKFVAMADPDALGDILVKAMGDHLILQSERHDERLQSLDFGVQTIRLLRALVSRMTPETRTRALDLICHARQSFYDAPKYDAFLDPFVKEDADAELSELRIAEFSIRAVGSLYEHRGRIVVELFWNLIHLLGWVKPNMPKDAHRIITAKLQENNVGETLDALPSEWRHWRNASCHKDMLQRIHDDSGMAILVRDESQGVENYRKRVTAADACAEAGKAISALYRCFPLALGLIGNELKFDLHLDEATIRSHCREALNELKHVVATLDAE